MENDKTSFYVVAIVAIVAVFGIVFMAISNSGTKYVATPTTVKVTDDTSGQAARTMISATASNPYISEVPFSIGLTNYSVANDVNNFPDRLRVSVGGQAYTIKVIGFSSTTETAIIAINGVSGTISTGQTTTIGGLQIHANSISNWNNGINGVISFNIISFPYVTNRNTQ